MLKAVYESSTKERINASLSNCEKTLNDPYATELQKRFAQKLLNRIKEQL